MVQCAQAKGASNIENPKPRSLTPLSKHGGNESRSRCASVLTLPLCSRTVALLSPSGPEQDFFIPLGSSSFCSQLLPYLVFSFAAYNRPLCLKPVPLPSAGNLNPFHLE